MANSSELINACGLKRKFDVNEIEQCVLIPKKLSTGQPTKIYNERLMFIKLINITESKIMGISDYEICLHRCVLLNNTTLKLRAEMTESYYNVPTADKQ